MSTPLDLSIQPVDSHRRRPVVVPIGVVSIVGVVGVGRPETGLREGTAAPGTMENTFAVCQPGKSL